MNPELVPFVTLGAVLVGSSCLAALAADALLGRHWQIARRVEEECRLGGGERTRRSPLFKRLDFDADRLRANLICRLREAIRRAGLTLSVPALAGICLVAAALGAAAAHFVVSHVAGVLAGGVAGFMLPIGMMTYRARARQAKFASQLPEAFELMSRAIRAGQTVVSTFDLVAGQMHSPIAEEFAYCCEQQKLGLPQDVVLEEFVERNSCLDLQMFAIALVVQRQSGGNLIEVLDNLAGRLRQRSRLRGRIRSLTSEGRMQAVVLMALPIVSLIFIRLLHPDYAQVLLDRPRVLAGLAVSQVMGGLWIRRIVNLDF